jgi:hypothetical protein
VRLFRVGRWRSHALMVHRTTPWQRGSVPSLTLTASRARLRRMSRIQTATGFSSGERDYIRRELDMFFSTYPSVADGFQLKTWRGGPLAGQPKLSPAAKGLMERRLMRLETGLPFPRLFFTDAGLEELRAMMGDRRLVDPVKFAHVRVELGINASPETTGAEP